MYPTNLLGYADLQNQPEDMCPGGSCIIDPMGQYVAEPVYNREETILADLDLNLITQSRLDFDVCGHYARPDVFDFRIK
jgi:nitrilase